MASCIRNIHTKNHQNPIIGFQVTVENVGDAFLGHSVYQWKASKHIEIILSACCLCSAQGISQQSFKLHMHLTYVICAWSRCVSLFCLYQQFYCYFVWECIIQCNQWKEHQRVNGLWWSLCTTTAMETCTVQPFWLYHNNLATLSKLTSQQSTTAWHRTSTAQ